METFTLFVVLPNEDICSLRNLPTGTSIRAVRKKLELSAGLPAQTYRLSCTKGQVLHEDHVLRLDLNVWDGFLLRAVFLDSWRELYEKVVEDDIFHVIQHGAVHMRKDVVWIDGEDEGRAREVMRERGVVALFLASFLGMRDMCKALLSVDVDPNGRTPFGRTPLFAAMTRDSDHVMELLLAHNARLEARDADGVTALDLARRVGAKECLRKVRHMKLQSAGESSPPGSRASSQAGAPGRRRRLGPRVIRIPSGNPFERQSSVSSMSSDKPANRLAVGESRGCSPEHSTVSETQHREGLGEGKAHTVSASYPGPPKSSSLPPPQTLFREGERYSWDNNLTPMSRTPTAAGTYARAPPPSHSQGRPPPSARPATRAWRGPGVSWSDSVSVSSGTTASRMLPFRPTVHDLSTKGPGSVLTTSSTSISNPTTTTTIALDTRNDTPPGKSRRPGSALVKFCANLPPPPQLNASSRDSSPPSSQTQEPHVPAQEPPGRPPTRMECKMPASSSLDAEPRYLLHSPPRAGSVATSSVMGSQEALSVGSAPEFATGSGGDTDRSLGAVLQHVDQGESDNDGGRVLSPRGKSPRTSGRFSRNRLLVSRRKQQESWRTMKRRIKLAEEQKKSNKTQTKEKEKARKENFEKWLERKRNERQQSQASSEEDDSDDDDDVMNRSAESSQAFTDWLKDLKERNKRRPQTCSPASLHRRKSRPLKGLIQIDGNLEPIPAPEPDNYMTAYQQWQHKKTNKDTRQHGFLADIREAKRLLEEKRKSMLAAALTYEDWLEHAEERKQLMQTILRADMEQLEKLEQHLFRARRAPRQISFDQWREKVEKKEADIRQHRQRMRKEAEQQDDVFRSSAAIAHEEWVRKKKEEATKNKSKVKNPEEGNGRGRSRATVSEDEKRAAWEAWLEQKHRHEVAQLDQHLRKERQLVLALRQKKSPTVTQC